MMDAETNCGARWAERGAQAMTREYLTAETVGLSKDRSRPQNRDKTGRFVTGASGNPGGRPAVDHDFQERCRDFMETKDGGWKILIDIAKNPKDDDQMRALTLISAYAYGKAKNSRQSHPYPWQVDVS